MKKIISKILIIFILIILLFEFSFSNSLISYAEDDIALPTEQLEQIASLGNGIVAIVLWIPKFIVTGVTWLINKMTSVIAKMENTDNPGTITPYKIFFNKYDLLSVNVFEEASKDGFVKELRASIATWYYIVRMIAVVILLVILVYVGIRMALASVADDKAKYKKMLFDWVVGLALIFVMHYIAIFTIYCNNAIVHAIEVLYSSTADSAEDMIDAIFMKSLVGLGLIADAAMIVYIGIVFQTIFYLIAYINRMLKVSFLLIISPLITVTYSIDKMGDGKAQALGTWLKEYVYTILIQPFHCIIYFTFVSTAFTLVVDQAKADYSYNALSAGVLAILCIKFINDAEKIVRKIFGFQDDNSKTSMAAGAIMGVAMVKNATKTAKSIKGGANKIGNFGAKLGKDFKQDAPKLRALAGDGALGKGIDKISGGLNKVGGAISKGKSAVANSKVGKTVGEAKNKANRNINKAKTMYGKLKTTKAGRIADLAARKALTTSAAIMGFAATYATGDTDALSAIGYGSALGRGADELFNTSHERNMNEAVTSADEADKLMFQEKQMEHKEAEADLKQAEDEYDEAKPALEAYKAADTYDEQADKLSNEVTNDRKALEGLKVGSPKYQKAMKNIKPKEDKIKKLREKAKQSRERAEKLDKTGEVTEKINSGKDGKKVKAKDVDNSYKKKIESKEDRVRGLEREIREFYEKGSKEERIKSLRNSVTDQTIKDKAKQIEKLIQQMIAKRDQMANAGNDNGENEQTVSYEDMMQGKNIASLLQANIEKDFIDHSGLSATDLINKAGGEFFSMERGEGTGDQELAGEMNDMVAKLRLLVTQQQINQRARGIDKSADIDKSMGRREESFDKEFNDRLLL